MANSLVVVVDADVIIAQVIPNDIHHDKTSQISEYLVKNDAQLIYPASAIAEATTFIQRVLDNTALAYDMAVLFSNPNFQVTEIDQDVLRSALGHFSPTANKKNTLFDCIVAVTAKMHQADAIFSFDKFYTHQGFKLASELL